MSEDYVMGRCNDCGSTVSNSVVRGVSDLAGGEYYNGLEICDNCAVIRREKAIADNSKGDRHG